MVVNNLAAYYAAIAAVAPIDGVDAAGGILFQATATPDQIAAANTVKASYVDAPPQFVPVKAVLAALTDAEYVALMQAVQSQLASRPGLHRAFMASHAIDLADAKVQNIIQAIVTAGILTAARAQAVFVAPPAPATPVMQPPPAPRASPF